MTNPLIAGLTFDGMSGSLGSVLLWSIATAAGAAFLVFTYWGIFQRSERSQAWVLFALRASGLLVLWLTLAKPAWLSHRSIEEPAHVAVILDDSASMSLSDSGKSSRYQQARQSYERLKHALENRGVKKLTSVDLFDILGNPLGDGPKTEPIAERTHLAAAISTVFSRAKAKPLAGIILISDGADNSGRVDLGGMSDLRQRDAQIGVYAIGFPKPDDPSVLDFAIGKLSAPERAMVNNKIAIEVPVTKSGGPEAKAIVSIKLGGETIAAKKVSFAHGKGQQLVSLDYTPSLPGSFQYVAVISTSQQESILTNNSANFPLQVDAEPIKVFYLEGSLRWEFRYLKDRLEQDPDVNLQTVIRRLNPDRAIGRPAKELLSAEGLKNIDVLILGDIEGKFFTDSEYESILAWLDQKNHSLLVLGGYQSFGAGGWRNTPLAKALPVIFAETEPFQREGPFVPRLTDEGKRHPSFQFSTGIQDMNLWNETARLDGLCLVQRAKPSATVLAVHPELKIDNEPAVVACWQNYGGGKSMVLTVDTTWQWSRIAKLVGKEDTIHRRFWSQTIRWLAGRGNEDRRPLLNVSTARTGYEPGQPVEIKVNRYSRPDIDFTNAEWSVEVRTADGQALCDANGKPVAPRLQANPTAPEEFTASLTAPASGRYQIDVRLLKEGKLLANQSTEFMVQGSSLEMADPIPKPELLKSIASATGGIYIDVGQEDRLIDQLPSKGWRREWDDRREFWNSPMLFVLFLVLVSAEWFIRRRNHLV
jgi:uncharacterized membrane protein